MAYRIINYQGAKQQRHSAPLSLPLAVTYQHLQAQQPVSFFCIIPPAPHFGHFSGAQLPSFVSPQFLHLNTAISYFLLIEINCYLANLLLIILNLDPKDNSKE